MKNRIITSSIREIKNSFTRYLSLLIMSMLGVFVFVGLQSTAPDMIYTLDSLYDEYNIYDIKIQSSLGLSNEDINLYKNINDIDYIEGVKTLDVIYDSSDEEYVIELNSLPLNINKIKLESGKLPENDNEIVVEKDFLTKTKLNLGDFISISSDKLNKSRFKITGIIYSPLYLNSTGVGYNRGNTNVGSGKINFYAYTNHASFNFSYYTTIYITSNKAKKLETSSEKYKNLINEITTDINKVKDTRESVRVTEAINEEVIRQTNLLNQKYEYTLSELNSLLGIIKIQCKDNDCTIDTIKDKYNEVINYLNTLDKSSSEYNEYNLKASNLKKLQDSYDNLILAFNTLETTKLENLEKINEYKNTSINELTSITHVYNRSDYSTYKEYVDDSNSIKNLSKIFPIVFYLVAILVSLVSMSRMVEEDRNNLGTLKSLGFDNYRIIVKYIIFSLSATIIGGFIGAILGSFIIPALIFNIYTILFYVPDFLFKFNTLSMILGITITIICIVGATLYTAIKTLKEKPSELLRPKSPKNGKKIILENFKSLWNKLSFSKKVTIRNLFRYKRRALVTIFGMAGCTALMLCGFGIRDSIKPLPKKQYEEIFKSDAIAYSSSTNKTLLNETFKNNSSITSFYSIEQLSITIDQHEATMLILPNDSNFDSLISLKEKETSNNLNIPLQGCYISDKFAQVLNVKVNDEITLIDSTGNEFKFNVLNIVENYINHYIYISEESYNSLGYEFLPNMTFFNTVSLDDDSKTNLAKELISSKVVFNVSFSSELIKTADDMLGSLNKVVIILIVLSMLLSFVVLYNLSNINMHERRREIATLKVLGFYDKEVDRYITTENIILTIIGIIIGLIIGYYLAIIVSKTVEIDRVRFIYNVMPLSFLYSSILSLLFAIIVNLIAHFTLKRIDMIESLKSVE